MLAGAASYAAEKGDLTDLSLQDLMNVEIFSASKFLQKASEAPSSITIITAEEIQRYGYRNINDVLRALPGFYVTNDRNYSYIGERGFSRPGDYNIRLLILVDGHRLNDNVFDSVLAGDESPIDIDIISRIEVIRGPSSSLYGNSAFFGIINIVTKTGRDIRGGQASAEIMSNGRYKGRSTVGQKFESGLEYLFSGSVLDSRGHDTLYFPEYDSPGTNFGIAQKADAERNRTLYASLRFKDLSIHAGYGSRKKIIPTGAFETVFNTDRTFTIDERTFADLQYDKQIAASLGLTVRFTFDRYRYNGDYLYSNSDTDTPYSFLNRDYARGDSWGTEVQLTKRFLARHRFTAGLEYRNNFNQDQFNHDEAPYFSHLADTRGSALWAFYAQDEYKITKDLILNAGLRHDYYDSFGGTTNPRIGLIYGYSKRTNLKFLYGQAFRAPSTYEQYYRGGTSFDNPSLKPESIRTYEVVVERRFGENLRIGASFYDYGIKNLISQELAPITLLMVYQNASKVNAKGMELQISGRASSGLQTQFSYTLQQAKDTGTNSMLSGSPKHMAKAGLSIPCIRGKLFAGLEAFYMSSRRTIADNAVGGYTIANLTLFSQKLFRNFELSGGLYNIFGKRYADPGSEEHRQNGIDQDGRTFRLRALYHIPFSEGRR